MIKSLVCPNCLAGSLKAFHSVQNVPVHSVLLMPTRDIAVSYPRGSICLGWCGNCGFVSNTSFDPSAHHYSTQYEETQGFSSTFRAFHARLADNLIEKYDLHRKTVIEIGCGKGEFLSLLCEKGSNRGIGFDPAFVSERNPAPSNLDIQFVQDFYSEKYVDVKSDFYCCKMTLEHIPDTANFVRVVRQAIGENLQATVFFQVPDLIRVLKDIAFWDIYYEHCSYFCAGSLARVFREAGFDVLETWTDYDDQYLMITAKPCLVPGDISDLEKDTPNLVSNAIKQFLPKREACLNTWKQRVSNLKNSGGRTVIWGSGSKGVAFLSLLDMNDAIEYVVDINPYRQGKFMAGTGQQIVSPAFLQDYKPDVAIAMNPIYQSEIKADLNRMGLSTEVLCV